MNALSAMPSHPSFLLGQGQPQVGYIAANPVEMFLVTVGLRTCCFGDSSMTTADQWVQRDIASVWHGFTQMQTYASNAPIIVAQGKDRHLIDVDGKHYLDAISSVWMITLGHGHPELNAALTEQAAAIAHSTMLGNGNAATIVFAEALSKVVPVEDPKIIFASDGAAAVEQALKIAFQFHTNTGNHERTRYLTFDGAYHGDTIGSISVGAGGFGTDLFEPLRFPVLRAPNGSDTDWADAAIRMIETHGSRLAAMIIEPIVQGASGVLLLEPEDVARVTRAARAAGMLVIFDEVATGFGRTGTLFATEQVGEQPDLLCLGKGMTGGYLPMSATVASGAVAAAFLGADLSDRTFYHGHSYGGNALAAAVATKHLALILDPAILANVTARATQLENLLTERIATLPEVRAVRQHGLMAGVEIDTTDKHGGPFRPRRICAATVQEGVLLRSIGNTIPIVPILTSTSEEIEEIVEVLRQAIEQTRTGAFPA